MEKVGDIVYEVKSYNWITRIIFFLDIFIAILILFFSKNLIETEFGRVKYKEGFEFLEK